jgi:hypothetical protein
MQTDKSTPSTQKVRRDIVGGKRGRGHEVQFVRRIRRRNPYEVHYGRGDAALTSAAGLVEFGRFTRELGIERELKRGLGDMKVGEAVVYRMDDQIRTLVDLFVMGEHRVFGLEAAAADPLFAHLAGGSLCSVDTMYRDLARFDDERLEWLDNLVGAQVEGECVGLRLREAHVDIDTTVEPVFGNAEGAVVGYNPRFHGRPSYHPILGHLAEVDMLLGGQLRPGNTTFGAADVEYVNTLLARARRAVGPRCVLYARMDCAADCTEYLRAVHDCGAYFLVKGRMTPDLAAAVSAVRTWHTVDVDADGKPTRQVAEVTFRRGEWGSADRLPVRVIAVRTAERERGPQLYLWEGLDMSVQTYLCNDMHSDADDLAWRHDKRAGIEPLIAELKGGWGIGAVPTEDFRANHAALLIKLLTHNLLRRYVRSRAPRIQTWRTPWIRRVLILIPGRMVRSGRRRILRMAPRPGLSMRC